MCRPGGVDVVTSAYPALPCRALGCIVPAGLSMGRLQSTSANPARAKTAANNRAASARWRDRGHSAYGAPGRGDRCVPGPPAGLMSGRTAPPGPRRRNLALVLRQTLRPLHLELCSADKRTAGAKALIGCIPNGPTKSRALIQSVGWSGSKELTATEECDSRESRW